MGTLDEPAPDDIRVAAERVLAASFGDVRLDAGVVLDSSDRSAVVRFQKLHGADLAPSSVIVKRAIDSVARPSDEEEPNSVAHLFNEWASLQFLGEVISDNPVAPRFLGGDKESGILVMEDVGSEIGLVESLLGDDPEVARAALIAYATTVGRMHGQTAGRGATFHQIAAQFEPPSTGVDVDWLGPIAHSMLDALDIIPPAGLDDDLETLAASIAAPGPFAVFIHADPCPDNWARSGSGDCLFDFEFATIGHALLDGVYGRVPFPTCWCVGRLPEDVTLAMERAYRTELSQGCMAARDDALYSRGMAEVCAYWLVYLCRYSPMLPLLAEDFEWGTATVRQRLLARLDVVIQVTRDADHLTAIGRAAEDLVRELGRRWDADAINLPLYPAFRSR
jgi:hypothetical protein